MLSDGFRCRDRAALSPILLRSALALLFFASFTGPLSGQAMYTGTPVDRDIVIYTILECTVGNSVEDSLKYTLPPDRNDVTMAVSGTRSCPYGTFNGILTIAAPGEGPRGTVSADGASLLFDGSAMAAFTASLAGDLTLLVPVDTMMETAYAVEVIDSRLTSNGSPNCPNAVDAKLKQQFSPGSVPLSLTATCNAVGLIIDPKSKIFDAGNLVEFKACAALVGFIRMYKAVRRPNSLDWDAQRVEYMVVAQVWYRYTPSGSLEVKFDPPEIKSGQSATIEISMRDAKGNVIDSFDGGAKITLDEVETTRDITRLQAEQSVLITKGRAQPVFVFTPKTPFDANTDLNVDAPLAGKIVVRVTLENSPLPPVRKELPVKSPLNFTVDRVELQQGIVNSDRSVTLPYKPDVEKTFGALPHITSHPTILRVFLKYENTVPIPFKSIIALTGITARCTVLKNGSDIATYNISGSGTQEYIFSENYASAAARNLTNGLYTVLPTTAFREAGTYSTEVQLKMPPHLAETKADESDNVKSFDHLFAGTRPLRVLFMRGDMQGLPLPDCQIGGWEDAALRYPIDATKMTFNPPDEQGYSFSGGMVFSDVKFMTLWRILSSWNKYNPADQRQFLVMFMPGNLVREVCENPTAGCAMYSLGVAVSVPNDPVVATHEVGHLLGLRDTYKSTQWKTVDGDPNPRRKGADDGGNWVEEGNINLKEVPPRASVSADPMHEFMGTSSSWIDRVTWDYLYQTRFRIGSTGFAPLEPQAGSYIAIAGTITKTDSVLFEPFLLLSQIPVMPDTMNGAYAVKFADRSGTILDTWRFPVFFHIPEGGDRDRVPFAVNLALPSQTAKVMITRFDSTLGADKVIGSKTFSANPPTVSVLAPKTGQLLSGVVPVRWTAHDPDGDPLVYDVLYSPDGQKQMVVAVGLRDTVYQWNTRQMPPSTSCSFTIVATDGVNEGRATSGPFVLTDVEDEEFPRGLLPAVVQLQANYPNPFSTRTAIMYTLPRQSPVRLTITDMLGREVALLVDREQPAGFHSAPFEAAMLPSGVYIATLSACGNVVSRTVIHAR